MSENHRFMSQAEMLLAMSVAMKERKYNQPSDLGSWTPQSRYDFLDLACGEDALRARAVSSENPDWTVLAVDPQIASTNIEGKLELVKAKAHEVLEKLFDESVNTVNADYFLTDVPKEYAAQVLTLLPQKMKDGKKLRVGYKAESEGYVLGLVRAHGFVSSEPTELSESEIKLSPSAQREFKIMQDLIGFSRGKPAAFPVEITRTGKLMYYVQNPEAYKPMQFTATIKKTKH